MKDFGNRGFRIANSPLEVRLVYTGFLIFAFIGYLTISLVGFLRVGPTARDVAAHYRGSDGNEEAFARPVGQMLEEAHFHAFIEGLILLTLCHLFAATSISGRAKITIIAVAFVSTLTDLAAPWIVRFLSPAFAYAQMAAWAGMIASALALISVPLYEMWFSGGRK